MRRKSERNKNSPNAKQPEKITRRTTRRNKKSPEKSINEEESENSSEQEESGSSENEVEEQAVTTPKRTRRTSTRRASEDVKEKPTPRPRRRGAAAKQLQIAEEDCITADTSNDENALKTEVEPSSTSFIETTEGASKSDDESMATNLVNSNNVTIVAADDGDDEKEVQDLAEKETTAETDEQATDVLQPKEQENVNSQPHVESQNETNENENVQKSNREVIPEETDQAVEIDSTTTSASSIHDKRVLNDLSAADAAKTKIKNKKISEISADTTSEGDRDGPASTTEDVSGKETAENRTDENVNGTPSEDKNRKKINLKDDNSNRVSSKPSTVRKRRWLSKSGSINKSDVITISTDSLKGLISDVKPVPLSDVRLESSPEPDREPDDVKVVTSTSYDYNNRRSDDDNNASPPPTLSDDQNSSNLTATRKISIMTENIETRPPSPPKHSPSNILYITNLVRPFTALQLKGLLVRTGKIVENGFWMDKIKSKCFVKYETEE